MTRFERSDVGSKFAARCVLRANVIRGGRGADRTFFMVILKGEFSSANNSGEKNRIFIGKFLDDGIKWGKMV